jgi:phosphatidylglycerophosphate synthase
MSEQPLADRRPIRTRGANWAQQIARLLAGWNITPNQISVLSVMFAAAGAWLILQSGWWLLPAALCIQLRLLCNLFDGMVAVEYERQTPTGALYNEFPDRVADSLLIVAAGYAAGQPALGWFGALAAALTAYIRVFGGACQLPQDFRGPMAKPQRMAMLTMACLMQGLSNALPWMAIGLAIIAAGSVLTCVTRTRALAAALHARDAAQ